MKPCKPASGYRDGDGYAHIWDGGRDALAHRVAWEQARGPILDGKVVDHTCYVRDCVEIEHLRLLTRAENAALTRRARATACKWGHEYTPENTYLRRSGGKRQCRTCQRAAAARYQSRKKAHA